MSIVSINTNQRYLLNGIEFNAPIEWQEAVISATYENDSVQPQISSETFTFSNEARQYILDWINEDKIFEGLPFTLTLFNNSNQSVSFNSVIDFTLGYRDLPDDGKIEVNTTNAFGLDNFFAQIEALTYGYLESIGVIKGSDYIDIPYVVEKPFNLLEIVSTSIVIYLMVKEVAESVKRIADNIATISGIAAAGITGSVGALIYAAATLILNLIYTTALIIAIVDLTNTLISSFLTLKRDHKALNLRRALEIVCSYYGYGFETSVSEFSNVAYIPSNQEVDGKDKLGFIKFPKGTQKGIPNSGDNGYVCSEMFERAKQLCDGRYAIINNVVQLRPKDDPFWIKNSTFEMKPVLIEQKTFNMDELESTKLLKFSVDVNDEYTIDNYLGTSIEVKTDVINIGNQRNNTLKGLLEVDFGLALGSRKNELTPFENLLKSLASVVDNTTGILGGGTRFENKIKDRVGVMKQSQNWHSIPKLVYVNGGIIPNNQRNLFSAPVLYNKYYQEQSFVTKNFRGQKAIYRDVTIPFGLEDYKKLINNSYFIFQGSEAKIISFEWTMGSDTATVDFWVREVYTKNLKETQIIQS